MKLKRLAWSLVVSILWIQTGRAAESTSWLDLTQGAGHALDKQDGETALRYNLAALIELEKMAKMHQHINAVRTNRAYTLLHSLLLNLTYVYDKQVMDMSLKRLDEIRSNSNINLDEINRAIAQSKERRQKQREAAYDSKLTPEQRMDAMHQLSQQLYKETEETRSAYKKAEDMSIQAKLPTLDKMVSAQKQIAELDARVAAAYSSLLGPKHELTTVALKNQKQAEEDYTKFAKEYQDIQSERTK